MQRRPPALAGGLLHGQRAGRSGGRGRGVFGEEGGEVGLDGLDGGLGLAVEVAAGGAEVAAAAEVRGDGGGVEGGRLVAGADAEAGDAGFVLGLVEEEADLGGGDGAGDVDGVLDLALGDAGAAEVRES